MNRVGHGYEYHAISGFYGGRTAKRSGVRLMNHIDEGLIVLDVLGSPEAAKAAFCLHPLFQADDDLMTVACQYMGLNDIDPMSILLVMEYRQWANAFLPGKVTIDRCEGNEEPCFITGPAPTPGPIPEVRHMLIADKVQNRKDFEQFHKGKHARSVELDYYFKLWLKVLGIDENTYQAMCHRIEKTKP